MGRDTQGSEWVEPQTGIPVLGSCVKETSPLVWSENCWDRERGWRSLSSTCEECAQDDLTREVYSSRWWASHLHLQPQPELTERSCRAHFTPQCSAGPEAARTGEKNSTLGLRRQRSPMVEPRWGRGGHCWRFFKQHPRGSPDFWGQPLCHSSLPNTEKPHRPHLPCRAGSRQSAAAEAANKDQLGDTKGSCPQGRADRHLSRSCRISCPSPSPVNAPALRLDLGQLGLGERLLCKLCLGGTTVTYTGSAEDLCMPRSPICFSTALLWGKGKERGKHTLDNQQGPTIQHRELCSLLCGSLDGREVQGEMGTWTCMAESLCHSSETITILLISCTLIQNKRFLKNQVQEKVKQKKSINTMKQGFPGGSDGKEFTCNTGDLGSIPGLERSPGHGNPLQYSCLENSMDRAWWVTVHGVTKIWTWLSD